ncbi:MULTISPECIES: MinD/ParA family protein [unclassified Thioalkalivibrio]|uniref:MinD/ParA family protein n=1 Tax=unclassified Thioalkalivibrio TaxID=2621013 RepID=UPI00037645B0|nr:MULTISPECIES: MinD/ParA family protein [unclassified Thioalkalivibrio]
MPDRNGPADPRSAAVARPRVLAVASGKGGVGKSSIAVNLGITLARRGRRVLILDGDTGLANVNILLGLRPERGLPEVLAGECDIEDILLEGPHGVQIIPGASGIREYAELGDAHQRRLVTELGRIEQDFDDLLLDTAAGIGDTTLDFLAASHQVLLVLTPEPTSLTDAFSLLKLALRQQPLDVRVVVNMVTDVAEARSVFQRFGNAVEKYLHTRVDFLGFVQRDESLRTAVTLQHPVALFAEGDPSARPFQRLANALDDDPPRGSDSAFSRFWRGRFAMSSGPEAAVEMEPGAGSAPDMHANAERDTAAEPGDEPEDGAAGDSAPVEAPPTTDDPVLALNQLRMAFETALEVADPEGLASVLSALHEQYRVRTGQSAIEAIEGHEPPADAPSDPQAVPEAPDDVALREVLDADAPTHPPSRVGRGADLVAPKSTQPPDFGWRSAGAGPGAGGAPRARRAPGFDHKRFGSQDALLARLRELDGQDVDLAEFLRRL